MKPLLLEVIGQDAHYQLRLTQRLSVVSGDSATGKTALINTINAKGSVVNCSLQVFTIPSNAVNLNPYKDCCIIVDLDAIYDVNSVTALTKLNAVEDNIYLVLMGRKYLKNVALSIFALYDFKCIKGVTKNIQRYTENLKYITAYPELRNKIISNKVDQYMTSLGIKEDARQAELDRLSAIAKASGCTVEDIINDLI